MLIELLRERLEAVRAVIEIAHAANVEEPKKLFYKALKDWAWRLVCDGDERGEWRVGLHVVRREGG